MNKIRRNSEIIFSPCIAHRDPTHPSMDVDRGGGGGGGVGDISPSRYFRWGDGLYYHPPPPPNISRLNVILYRQNICEVPTKIVKETAGFECRNAKKFLARIHIISIISMWVSCRQFVRRLKCHVISRETAQNVQM